MPSPNSPVTPAGTNDAASILEAGRLINALQNHGVEENQPLLAVVPKDHEVSVIDLDELEPWMSAPFRKKGTFEFADVDSFIRYTLEHKEEDTRIFAAITDTSASFKSVLNFHGEMPSFNDHIALVTLRSTHEWQVWNGHANQGMSQSAFASFLEKNSEMFVTPSGTDLLALIENLEGHANVSVSQGIKLQTGAIRINYTEDVELKGGTTTTQDGTMELPKELVVGIAPFEGVAKYEMKARLRYRIADRRVSFLYEPVNPHLYVRTICADIIQTITKQTGLEPFKI